MANSRWADGFPSNPRSWNPDMQWNIQSYPALTNTYIYIHMHIQYSWWVMAMVNPSTIPSEVLQDVQLKMSKHISSKNWAMNLKWPIKPHLESQLLLLKRIYVIAKDNTNHTKAYFLTQCGPNIKSATRNLQTTQIGESQCPKQILRY
jgi:hypothetical protein